LSSKCIVFFDSTVFWASQINLIHHRRKAGGVWGQKKTGGMERQGLETAPPGSAELQLGIIGGFEGLSASRSRISDSAYSPHSARKIQNSAFNISTMKRKLKSRRNDEF
jgi:hypothetical protein